MDNQLWLGLSDEMESLVKTASARLVHIGNEEIPYRTGYRLDEHYIVTPSSAASENEEIEVMTHEMKKIRAKVIGFDAIHGLALLKTEDAVTLPPLTTEDPRAGMLAMTVAFPSPAGVEARLDLIRYADADSFQTDGAPFPGFSGSAVFGPGGKILGLVTSNAKGNKGLAITYRKWLTWVERLKSGSTKKRTLGIRTQPVEAGLLIVEVLKGSSAEKAGLLVGDLLKSIDGKVLDHPFAILRILDESTGEIGLDLLRGGKNVSLKLIPDETVETVVRRWKEESCCR